VAVIDLRGEEDVLQAAAAQGAWFNGIYTCFLAKSVNKEQRF